MGNCQRQLPLEHNIYGEPNPLSAPANGYGEAGDPLKDLKEPEVAESTKPRFGCIVMRVEALRHAQRQDLMY
jgi:hypothetical protein